MKILLSEELQGGQTPAGLGNLRIGMPVNIHALRGMVYGTNQKYPDVDGEVITEEDAAALFALVTSPTRAEIIPRSSSGISSLRSSPTSVGKSRRTTATSGF